MNDASSTDFSVLAEQFALAGPVLSAESIGIGHIHDTYLVKTQTGDFVFQRVNTEIFRNPDELMENVLRVTDYMAKRNDPALCGTPRFMRTRAGKPYARTEKGDCWRCYHYIGGVVTYQIATPPLLRRAGEAFGSFLRQMRDFPADSLVDTIPDFHHTPKRFLAFERAVETARAHADLCTRARQTDADIRFAMERRAQADMLTGLQALGGLPLRVTHNDTKLNNVLFDEQTNDPVCIIDLDTIMPGLAAVDFGDGIRSGANTADEDESDLSKVRFDRALYDAYREGFLKEAGDCLTALEIQMLPWGAKVITLEQGIRFLGDYLTGDTYYKTSRPGQNLDRARTQFKLVADMEKDLAQELAEGARAARIFKEKSAI